jgi:hypothetical protein
VALARDPWSRGGRGIVARVGSLGDVRGFRGSRDRLVVNRLVAVLPAQRGAGSSWRREALANVLATFAQFDRRLISPRTDDAPGPKRAQGVRLGPTPPTSS